jgi:Fe-S-cluster containining protein
MESAESNIPGDACASDAAVCRECAEAGGCCCRAHPAATHLCFPLSEKERQRLVPYAHLATNDVSFVPAPGETDQESVLLRGDAVCVSENNHPDFIKAMRKLFSGSHAEIARLFPQGGSHLRLRTLSDGSCVFLGDQGCRLPRMVRPWYCLLFPAWVQGTTVTLFLQESCLVARRAEGPLHGISLMGVQANTVYSLFALLQKDWGVFS